jgi:hypothetical protein
MKKSNNQRKTKATLNQVTDTNIGSLLFLVLHVLITQIKKNENLLSVQVEMKKKKYHLQQYKVTLIQYFYIQKQYNRFNTNAATSCTQSFLKHNTSERETKQKYRIFSGHKYWN